MTEEKWESIKQIVERDFEVLESEVVELPATEGKGTKEILIFKGPLGKIKLEFIVKPVVLDTKTVYSKRAGQQTKVDYVVSETEKVKTFLAFLWNQAEEDWVKMSGSNFESQF